MKKLHLWPRYIDCMARGLSVRRAARFLHVSPGTAFRWRHALLDEARTHDDEVLSGWVELEWTWFAFSEKGKRRLDRPPRRRGIRIGRQFLTPRVTVAIACDRHDRVMTGIMDENPARGLLKDAGRLGTVLSKRLRPRCALLAATGCYGPAAILACRLRIHFHDARPDAGPCRKARSIVHLRNVVAYRRRLRDWIRRFRGVATRYLSNYLVWHRALERSPRGLRVRMLRWPLDFAFP